MLPLNNGFGVLLSQILNAVVNQLVVFSYIPHPTDQFSLFEVRYVSFIHLDISVGAPFLVGLQVNEPYLIIVIVRHHNLLRTDNLNPNIPQVFSFHFLPEQGLSVGVSVEKNNFALFII